jgi:glucans biosynthesis protein C
MRAFYIDRIRVLLTMLVIFHHTAIAFGASGGWYYMTPSGTTGLTQMLLSAQMAINQAFFMSLFFFISALLMPASYDRKGFRKFLKDRLVRLGIPLIVYIFVIHPTLVYFIYEYKGNDAGSWFAFWKIIITKYPGPGPMWFVLTLLVFETVYALYRRFGKGILSGFLSGKMPSVISILLFMIITGMVAFWLRLVYPTGTNFFGLQFGYFSLYIAMYFMGIIASRGQWLEKLTVKKTWPWFIIALLAIPVLMVVMKTNADNLGPFSGGLNSQALFYALWEPFVCVGISYFLLLFFKKHWNNANTFVSAMSGDSYAAYIIHPVIVVSATMMTETLSYPPIVRMIIVLLVSIPLCFMISHLLRKIPGMIKIV